MCFLICSQKGREGQDPIDKNNKTQKEGQKQSVMQLYSPQVVMKSSNEHLCVNPNSF